MKVFSCDALRKCRVEQGLVNRAFADGWPQRCEGMTAEQMLARHLHTTDAWMVEQEDINDRERVHGEDVQ